MVYFGNNFKLNSLGILLFIFKLLGVRDCTLAINNGYCRDKTISVTGDLNIAVPISIHTPNDDNVCGNISISGFQAAVAVGWIINILNENNSESYIPGIKLGYTIYDDCGLPWRTSSFLTSTFHKSSPTGTQECGNTSNTTSPYVGVMTISSPLSSAKAMKLGVSEVPVININYHDHKYEGNTNAFHGQDSIKTEIQAILQFLNKIDWNFIGVVYTEDTIGKEYLRELITQSSGSDNCYLQLAVNQINVDQVVQELITEANNFAKDETFGVLYLGLTESATNVLNTIGMKSVSFSIASKLMIVLPSTVRLGIEIRENMKKLNNDIFIFRPYQMAYQEFKTYFEYMLETTSAFYEPWLSEYKQRICRMQSKNVCQTKDIITFFVEESSVGRSIESVLLFAKAIKQMKSTFCKEYLGICNNLIAQLQSISTFMHNATISPQTDGSLSSVIGDSYVAFRDNILMTVGQSTYDIYQFKLNSEKKIGSFMNGTLYTNVNIKESVCKIKCSRCIENQRLQFGHVPGSVYILGLFSIHQEAYTTSHNESTVFKCGEFRAGTNAIITVSAFLESVKLLRAKTKIDFGAIALDDCYNELNISALIIELFTGSRVLYHHESNKAIDFSKVIAVVGALSSGVTQRIGDIMSSLHIPMVSYGASSTNLDNRIRYPYFLRTVPSDALQIQGLVQVISNLRLKYIGALYIDDAYGSSGMQGVVTMATSKGKCVYGPRVISEDTDAAEIKTILKEFYIKQVKFITLFSIDTVVQNIIRVLGDNKDDVLSNYEPIFLSSEAWGTNSQLATKESAGSLIFTTDRSKTVNDNFENYLKFINLSVNTENPWLYRFLEDYFGCHMLRSFDKRFSVRCDMTAASIRDKASSLAQDQRNIHTDIAVNAIGFAYKSYTKTCALDNCFRRNKENAAKWTQAIRDIQIPLSDSSNFKPFKTDQNGNLGFTIHNIQKSSDGYFYAEVGTFNETLSLQSNKLKFYTSAEKEIQLQEILEKQRIPTECTKMSIEETTTVALVTDQKASQDTTLTVVFGSLAGLLFLVVILLVLIVFRALRRTDESKNDSPVVLSTEHSAVHHHHRNERGMNGIYHEPHSEYSSSGSIRVVQHNRGFSIDNESIRNNAPSASSVIVAGFSSDSDGDQVMYSDMSQTTLNNTTGNKYLSLETPNESNNSLASLTRRVLQSTLESNTKQDDTNKDSALTYLSANDLVMTEEEEELYPPEEAEIQNFEKIDTRQVSSALSTPSDSKNILPPPYQVNGQIQSVKRPFSLPGVDPMRLSLRRTDKDNHGNISEYRRPPQNMSLYTQDMYLSPVSDSLPTYEQHVLHQQLQQQRIRQTNKIPNISPTFNNNTDYNTSIRDQNRTSPTVVSSPQHCKPQNGTNSMSPSSSEGGKSPNMICASPFQKKAFLLLQDNPSYFKNLCNYKIESSSSDNNSPQSQRTILPNENISLKHLLRSPTSGSKSSDIMKLHGVEEMDDREEVMI